MNRRLACSTQGWLLSAAAGLWLIGPGVLSAQSGHVPSPSGADPKQNPARTLREAVQRQFKDLFDRNGDAEKPTPAAADGQVVVAGGQVAADPFEAETPAERTSEVQQHLQHLYERKGRQMPPMTFSEMPADPAAVRQPAAASRPAASQPTGNPLTKLREKLVAKPAATPAAEPAPAAADRPSFLRRVFSPVGEQVNRRVVSPVNEWWSTQASQQLAQLRPKRSAPSVPQAAPQPETVVAAAEQESEPAGRLEKLRRLPEVLQASWPKPFSRSSRSSEPTQADALATAPASAPAMPVASRPAPPAASEENPFAELVEARRQQPPAASAESDAEENPFTGLTLAGKTPRSHGLPEDFGRNVEEAMGGTQREPEPTWAPTERPKIAQANAAVPAGEPDSDYERQHGDKLRRIAERDGKAGLKGFCPVALRDRRELVDSQPEFASTFESRTYRFSSAEAKAQFDQNPAKYAPVAGGNDIILLGDQGEEVAGTLDHAVWYKDRLHLFSSRETLGTFLESLNASSEVE